VKFYSARRVCGMNEFWDAIQRMSITSSNAPPELASPVRVGILSVIEIFRQLTSGFLVSELLLIHELNGKYCSPKNPVTS
jgi:hypothetical protein